jgi:hypothetical protein
MLQVQLQASSKQTRSYTGTETEKHAWENTMHEWYRLTLCRRKDFAAKAPDARTPRVREADRKRVYSNHTAATQRNATQALT